MISQSNLTIEGARAFIVMLGLSVRLSAGLISGYGNIKGRAEG